MAYTNSLATYTAIMAPIARSIKALEGRAANAADVYIFWLAIAASLRNLFTHDEDIDKGLAEKVTAIVNRRYKEFIDDSPTDVYFTAFFLDPHKPLYTMRDCANLLVQVTTNPRSSNGRRQQAKLSLYPLYALDLMKCHSLPPSSVQRNS